MEAFQLGIFPNAPASLAIRCIVDNGKSALNNPASTRVARLLKPLGAEWKQKDELSPTSSHIVRLNQSRLYPLPTPAPPPPPPPLLLHTTASLNLSHLASLFPLHASVPCVTGSRDAESRLGAAAPPCALFIAAPRCWATCVRAPCTTAGGVLLSHSHSLIIYTWWEGFLGCFFKEG